MKIIYFIILAYLLASCSGGSSSAGSDSAIADRTIVQIKEAMDNASYLNATIKVEDCTTATLRLVCPLADTTSTTVTLIGFKAEDYSKQPVVMVEGMYVIFQGRAYAYNATAQSLNPELKSDKIPVRFDKSEFRNWIFSNAKQPNIEISGCID